MLVKLLLSSFQTKSVETVSKEFPFHEFFDDAPKPLFPGKSFEEDLDIALSCYRYTHIHLLKTYNKL